MTLHVTSLGSQSGAGPDYRDMTLFARAILREAKGEGELCQVAIAWTIRNRAIEQADARGRAGSIHDLRSICHRVLEEDAAELEAPNFADRSFARAFAIACRVWCGDLADPTHGATRYHPHEEEPSWASLCRATALLGRYCFYRMPPEHRA